MDMQRKEMVRPKPVYINPNKPKLGTAYPHHPPSKRHSKWSWRYEAIDEEGKRQRRSLGRLDRGEVKRALIEKLQLNLPYVPLDLSDTDTIGNLLRDWYGHIEEDRFELKKRTKQNYLNGCKRIIPILDSTKLEGFGPQTVKHLRRILKKDYASSTVFNIIQTLLTALRWGEENGAKIAFPSSRIKNPKPKQKVKPVPAKEDVETILSSLPKSRFRLAVFIAYKTGARIGEIGNLQWKDIKEVDGCKVVSVNGKANPREIVIGDETWEEILSHRGEDIDDAKLFQRNLGNATTKLRRICEQASITPFTFQGLRKLRANLLDRVKLPDQVYEQQMGHSRKTAKGHYLQYGLKESQEQLTEFEVID